MDKNTNEKNKNFYFPLFCGIGIVFGIIFNQLAMGISLGIAIAFILDNK